MHSSSQGYPGSSADLYSGRGYGDHLMGHNSINSYSNYLSRDDPYNSLSNSGNYLNGPPLQSSSGYPGNSLSSLSQHTYPSSSSMSHHFGHQQDVYSSCVSSARAHSYPSPPVLPGINSPRQAVNSKSYWNNCEQLSQQQQQQQQHNQPNPNHCYSASSSGISSATHKSSPSMWTRSPNVMSSPSTTPSPIPCPSTPHLFSSSSPAHHSQTHSESHKSPYNGVNISNSNVQGNVNSNSNINCNANPLQSLQKMVQIDNSSEAPTEIRSPFETNTLVPVNVSSHTPQSQQHQLTGLESDPNYPTYYNLDQNRLCATPQSGYSNMSAQSINSPPFSPAIAKSTPEIRAQSCSKIESSTSEAEERTNIRSSNPIRFQGTKKAKGNCFPNNGSCSTDTCSNESLPASKNSLPISTDLLGQTEQTHDSFRSSETVNSRDSVKSSDSDGMSSYGVSQCSTPNNSWKMAPSTVSGQSVNPSNSSEFRPSNFSSNAHGKSWWAENGGNNAPVSQTIGASRSSFSNSVQNMTDCSPYPGGVNYGPNSQVTSHQATPSSISPNHSWTQQSSAQNSQLVTGASSYATQPDGVIVKKKRGRPFGSKNRRNLEAAAQGASVAPPAPSETFKRRRKTVYADAGVNTNLSFDVHGNLTCEDAYLFTDSNSLKHTLPLAMKRKKLVGPVIRIDKASPEAQPKYAVVNSHKFLDEEKEGKLKAPQAKLNDSSFGHARKNGLNIKKSSLLSSTSVNHTAINKNWFCILCHKGPNHKGLGDLYGPYFISLDRSKLPNIHEYDTNENNHEESESSFEQPITERRSLRRRPDPNEESKSKSQTNHFNDENGKDLTKINLEVWIHEDCIVWSNNVYLDGTKIRNLEPAIVDSFDNICTKCKLPGATLGCIFKNCNVSPLHYLCAKEKDCDLDEEKFILSCSKHKKRRILSKESETAVELSEATTTTTNDS